MVMTPRLCRRLRWGVGCVAAGVVVLAGASYGRPRGVAVGPVGVRAVGGTLVVMRATVPVVWRGGEWVLAAGGSEARVAHDGGSRWKPQGSVFNMLVGGPPAVLVTARLWSVPLWPAAGLAVVGAGLAWWRLKRRERAGGCGTCGYDTRGLSGVCPECGAG